MNGPRKGSAYEREVCRHLSLWWTNNEDDAVFWRSSTSGARATVRQRKGKQTFGQYGDVAATNPIGQPLLKFFTFELKCGYSRNTLHDLLDVPDTGQEQVWSQWIFKARNAAVAAGSHTWAIIARRSRRQALLVTPQWVFKKVLTRVPVLAHFTVDDCDLRSEICNPCSVCLFADFLASDPNHILDYVEKYQRP